MNKMQQVTQVLRSSGWICAACQRECRPLPLCAGRSQHRELCAAPFRAQSRRRPRRLSICQAGSVLVCSVESLRLWDRTVCTGCKDRPPCHTCRSWSHAGLAAVNGTPQKQSRPLCFGQIRSDSHCQIRMQGHQKLSSDQEGFSTQSSSALPSQRVGLNMSSFSM